MKQRLDLWPIKIGLNAVDRSSVRRCLRFTAELVDFKCESKEVTGCSCASSRYLLGFVMGLVTTYVLAVIIGCGW